MPETQLTVYQRIADPVAAVKSLGLSISQSLLLGCKTIAQGEVMALECMVRGIPPLMLAEKYHIIDGKLSMRSDAMLAEFNARGGKHRVLARTPELAQIELAFEGQVLVESYSWEEAQKEPTPYTKDGRGNKVLKHNWATPRARRQMLWARVVSEAVRTMMPGVNSGRYTPEELGDRHATDDAIDVPFTIAQAPPVAVEPLPAAIETSPAVASQPAPKDESTRSAIATLWLTLNIDDKAIAAQLARRNAKRLEDLTDQQAEDLLAALRKASQSPAPPAPPPQPRPPAAAILFQASQEASTLAGADLVASIRMKLNSDITGMIRKNIEGIGGLDNLTERSAKALLAAIENGAGSPELQTWLVGQCEGYAPF